MHCSSSKGLVASIIVCSGYRRQRGPGEWGWLDSLSIPMAIIGQSIDRERMISGTRQ